MILQQRNFWNWNKITPVLASWDFITRLTIFGIVNKPPSAGIKRLHGDLNFHFLNVSFYHPTDRTLLGTVKRVYCKDHQAEGNDKAFNICNKSHNL